MVRLAAIGVKILVVRRTYLPPRLPTLAPLEMGRFLTGRVGAAGRRDLADRLEGCHCAGGGLCSENRVPGPVGGGSIGFRKQGRDKRLQTPGLEV